MADSYNCSLWRTSYLALGTMPFLLGNDIVKVISCSTLLRDYRSNYSRTNLKNIHLKVPTNSHRRAAGNSGRDRMAN